MCAADADVCRAWLDGSLLMPIIAGAAAAAGIGALAQMGSAYMQSQFAAKQQQRAENFQKQVLKNRYQWQVGDMRRAGLNPALAVTQPSPGGAGGGMASMGMPDIAGAATGAASTALAAKRLKQELKNLEAEEVETYERAAAAKSTGWHQHFLSKQAQEMLPAVKEEARLRASSAKATAGYLDTSAGKRLEQWKRMREQMIGGNISVRGK